MTRRNRQTQPLSRWDLVLRSVILALGLFVLSILDYALSAHSAGLIAAALLLLALLCILFLRLSIQSRQEQAGTTLPDATPLLSARASVLILAGLTALAAVLRLYGLGDESFWYDETWTAVWAAQPLRSVVQTINPLAYLVAHWTMQVSRSEAALRLGPALAGIALIPTVYLLGRTLYGRCTGLVAAALISLSVYAIYHSQELRFYAWQMLFSMLTLYFLLRGLVHRRLLDWAGFAVTTILNLYSHPYALFVLASEGIYTLAVMIPEMLPTHKGQRVGGHRRFSAAVRRLAPPALGAMIALLAFAPGWASLASLHDSPYWAIDSELAVASGGGPLVSLPIATWTFELPSLLLALKNPVFLFVVFSIFFVGLLSSPRERVALVLFWLMIPPIVLFFVRVRFYHRYLSYLLPLFTIVMAHGIDHLSRITYGGRQRRVVVIALLTVLVAAPNIVQLPTYYRKTQKEQWREVIASVESNRQPRDIVLVTLNSLVWAPQQPFDWYRTVPDSELPWQFFPEGGSLRDPAQLRELPAVTSGHRRVWFVLPVQDTVSQQAITEALKEQFRPVQERKFVHLKVVLFEAVSPPLPNSSSEA